MQQFSGELSKPQSGIFLQGGLPNLDLFSKQYNGGICIRVNATSLKRMNSKYYSLIFVSSA